MRWECPARPHLTWLLLLVLTCLALGCTRTDYRRRADGDVMGLLWQKTAARPWQPPEDYSIYPAPNSRMHQSTCTDDPLLPDPAPKLYSYEVPDRSPEQETAPPLVTDEAGEPVVRPIPPEAWSDIPENCRQRMFDFASLRQEARNTEAEYGATVLGIQRDSDPKLTLEEIIEEALLNSRDYQSQKEQLYQVALQLSAERYAYALRPTATGNGADLAFDHNRFGGETVNGLAVPSTLGFQRALVTGGDLLARFANSVLLTFNGPQGFAVDVSSEFLLDISQPLLQRDVRLEDLTRAERNVIYAVRDFARFRKQFFVDFASSYYSLILDFRRVEIDSQNYFSLVRAFNQAEAEFRVNEVPRVQVDQVEQNLLQGRGRLIGTCNGVERSLDSLKIAMGLPTETRINIDLSEINELTQRDQLVVAGDLINRGRRRVQTALRGRDRLVMLSTGTVLLTRLIEASELQNELQQQESNETTDQEPTDLQRLRIRRARLEVEAQRLKVEQEDSNLQDKISKQTSDELQEYQDRGKVNQELLALIGEQLKLAELRGVAENDLQTFRRQQEIAQELAAELKEAFNQITLGQEETPIQQLLESAESLRSDITRVTTALDRLNETASENLSDEQKLEQIADILRVLIEDANTALSQIDQGLAPIDIDVDEAMLTALSLRFDLMNTREFLADRWREIKFAGDDLRSILDLRASQRIRTDASVNQPFNFTFDESRTDLSLTFDAPLNRRLQRNQYRRSLINYQQGLRNLMQAEDQIKFAVRNDLRSLALDREQYYIAVASAALAYERVISTSLEFRLGTGNVSARDFLESQTAYTNALTDVASQHIQYIRDRTQLFLDLELLTVDDDGFWNELYNESFQPEPYFGLPPWSTPVYGCLPNVRHSPEIRRMLDVGPGVPTIFTDSEAPAALEPNAPAAPGDGSFRDAPLNDSQ